jgi:hypothetical protein
LRREEQRLEAEKKESELRARNSIVRRDLDGAILAKKTAKVRLLGCKQTPNFKAQRQSQCECFGKGKLMSARQRRSGYSGETRLTQKLDF